MGHGLSVDGQRAGCGGVGRAGVGGHTRTPDTTAPHNGSHVISISLLRRLARVWRLCPLVFLCLCPVLFVDLRSSCGRGVPG
eukprot:scaffold33083_cov129-Isochrysis_galbana.AAC.4